MHRHRRLASSGHLHQQAKASLLLAALLLNASIPALCSSSSLTTSGSSYSGSGLSGGISSPTHRQQVSARESARPGFAVDGSKQANKTMFDTWLNAGPKPASLHAVYDGTVLCA